jgi:phosphatidylserine decarboxylase
VTDDPTVPLASEGYPLIGVSLAAAVLFWLLARSTGGAAGRVLSTLAVVALVVAGFFVNFFRDPRRLPPRGSNLVVSPADGKIVTLESNVEEQRFLHRPTTKISIFMSPLNVHVNRAPIEGEVVSVSYNHGKFFAAFAEKASLDNEQNAVLMRGTDGREVLFVQIAGFLARRIVCKVGPGDRLARGERMGMIKLGSRLDVYIPGRVVLNVKNGDMVVAGETVLGVLS